MTDTILIRFLLIAAPSMLVGMLGMHLLAGALRRRRLRRRFARAAAGERDAAEFLEAKGFQVVGAQVAHDAEMWIDGETNTYTVIADYLVERRGELAVVEVKTGAKAVDPKFAATRRQLLEYLHVYDVDAIYCYDAEAQLLQRVQFEPPQHPKALGPVFWCGVILAIGLLLILFFGL